MVDRVVDYDLDYVTLGLRYYSNYLYVYRVDKSVKSIYPRIGQYFYYYANGNNNSWPISGYMSITIVL